MAQLQASRDLQRCCGSVERRRSYAGAKYCIFKPFQSGAPTRSRLKIQDSQNVSRFASIFPCKMLNIVEKVLKQNLFFPLHWRWWQSALSASWQPIPLSERYDATCIVSLSIFLYRTMPNGIDIICLTVGRWRDKLSWYYCCAQRHVRCSRGRQSRP